MPTNRERVIAYLRTHPEGADDDQLSLALGITPRQQVNQICRALATAGIVSRREDLLSVVTPKASASMAQVTTAIKAAATGQAVVISSEASIWQFAYAGEVGLSEDQVKKAVTAALQGQGWRVNTRWGQEHGVDIEAHRGDERLVLEAKGEGSLNPMRVNYFLGALGELLQRMDSPNASYGLALPAHRQFVGLITRLPAWIRTHLKLRFFLVRPTASNEFEVGLIPPELP